MAVSWGSFLTKVLLQNNTKGIAFTHTVGISLSETRNLNMLALQLLAAGAGYNVLNISLVLGTVGIGMSHNSEAESRFICLLFGPRGDLFACPE